MLYKQSTAAVSDPLPSTGLEPVSPPGHLSSSCCCLGVAGFPHPIPWAVGGGSSSLSLTSLCAPSPASPEPFPCCPKDQARWTDLRQQALRPPSPALSPPVRCPGTRLTPRGLASPSLPYDASTSFLTQSLLEGRVVFFRASGSPCPSSHFQPDSSMPSAL